MLNLSGLPAVPIRVLLIVLFVLSSWATLATNWLGTSYLLANYFIILLGLWAEREQSPIPVQFFFFGLVFTFLNDILSVSISYHAYESFAGSTARFNLAMAIILILVKPVIGLFVYKEWQDRMQGGNPSNYETLGGGNAPSGGGYSSYENKGEMPPQYQPPGGQPFP